MDSVMKVGVIAIAVASCLITTLLLISMYLRDPLYNRLDKPNSLKYLRLLGKMQLVLIVLFIIVNLIHACGVLIDDRIFKSPSIFMVIMFCVFVFFNAMDYIKFYRYYLKHRDDKAIIAGWYMQKYFAADNKDDINYAYEYLYKASEYKSDSVYIWSRLAAMNERYFNKPDLTDEYLAKAHQVLNTIDNPSVKDRSILEVATGDILLCRDNIEEGLAHLKNACTIDPCEFTKKFYDNALEWAAKEEEESTPDSESV
jgi:tetratricopeptide (TPR) repeat protein